MLFLFFFQSQTEDIPGSKMDLSVGAYHLIYMHLNMTSCIVFLHRLYTVL